MEGAHSPGERELKGAVGGVPGSDAGRVPQCGVPLR